MEQSFLSIHDMSPEGIYRYASPALADFLGYEPRELVGESAYVLFNPDQVRTLGALHADQVRRDKCATQTLFMMRHKRGHWVDVECISNVVFDCLLCITFARSPASGKTNRRGAAAKESFSVSPSGQLSHGAWSGRENALLNMSTLRLSEPLSDAPREPRVAFLLNRFSHSPAAMFVSSACEALLGVAPETLIGASFYSIVAPCCVDKVRRVLEDVKELNSIGYERFCLRVGGARQQRDGAQQQQQQQQPQQEQQARIEVEAIFQGANDAVICIIRRIPSEIFALESVDGRYTLKRAVAQDPREGAMVHGEATPPERGEAAARDMACFITPGVANAIAAQSGEASGRQSTAVEDMLGDDEDTRTDVDEQLDVAPDPAEAGGDDDDDDDEEDDEAMRVPLRVQPGL